METVAENIPLISIVLCTYNGETYLAEQLKSLQNQTYSNFEIIISDDASTDATKNILKEYEQLKDFKVYYQPQNLGYIQNFAFALTKASGNFIALCDQDDVWLPNKIQTLFECFESNDLLVYSDSLLIDRDGRSMRKKLSDLRNMYSGSNTKGFFLFNIVWGHALMMHRNLLQYALPIPEAIPHDIWLAYKAATLSGVKYCNKVLTHYRQHEHAYTNTILPKNVQTRTMSKRYQDFLKQLYWLEVLMENASSREQNFYKRFYELFKQKENGRFNLSLFLFSIKHQHELYSFSKKTIWSKLIDLRKMARGERQDL